MECRRGAMRILSVRPSVSVKRVHCDKTEERSVQIFIPYERTFNLVFWEEWLVWATPSTWNFKSTCSRLREIADFQPIIIITSSSGARRNGSTTSDVFGKVTPVENIYLLLQNSRHTYAADYHYHAAVCSLVSALRGRCDRVRSEIGRCSAVSELRESDCIFTTTFDSNWLKTDIGSVQGGLSAELPRLLLRAAASGRAAIRRQSVSTAPWPTCVSDVAKQRRWCSKLIKSKQSDIVVQSPPSDMSLPVDRPLRPIACRSNRALTNYYI